MLHIWASRPTGEQSICISVGEGHGESQAAPRNVYMCPRDLLAILGWRSEHDGCRYAPPVARTNRSCHTRSPSWAGHFYYAGRPALASRGEHQYGAKTGEAWRTTLWWIP